tara:strand:+ start:2917 stop:3747 length:831 start_codon:yes stop_codon:yes gene_type:complete
MGTHNGYVENGDLFHKGDLTWADLSSWSGYTQWTSYTSTGNQSVSGAKGTALRYQSDIIDLGSVLSVYPEITIGCDGTAKVVIEHSANSDMSSATVLGSYTDNNALTGTYDENYLFLDYFTSGYEQPDKNTTAYTGFTDRYVRITVYVEKFASATERGNPALYHMTINLRDDQKEQEFITVADTSTLSGTVGARVIPLTKTIDPVTQIFYSDTNNTGGIDGKYITKTVSKANKTFRTINLDLFEDTTGIDINNLDIHIVGMPAVTETETGSIVRNT